jgi:hypothetical protein
LDFKKSVNEHFEYLFQVDEEEQEGEETSLEEKQFSSDYGWYQSIYAGAGGNYLKMKEVTKTKLMEFLTWLEFEKRKINLEALRLQKNKIKS